MSYTHESSCSATFLSASVVAHLCTALVTQPCMLLYKNMCHHACKIEPVCTSFAVFPCVLLYFIPIWTAGHSHLCILCASTYWGTSTLGHQFALLCFCPGTSVSMRTALTMVSCALFPSKSLNIAVSAHLYVVPWWYSCSYFCILLPFALCTCPLWGNVLFLRMCPLPF